MARNPRSVRFPPAPEDALEKWADAQGLPFNKAVVELVARGVAAEPALPPAVGATGRGADPPPATRSGGRFAPDCVRARNHIEGKQCSVCGGESS
jgi:hypothetical protein